MLRWTTGPHALLLTGEQLWQKTGAPARHVSAGDQIRRPALAEVREKVKSALLELQESKIRS